MGKQIAQEFKYTFIDTDSLIEEKYYQEFGIKISIQEIYEGLGEILFRRKEKDIITSLPVETHSVIATGGGTFTNVENRHHLKTLGMIIYLKSGIEALLPRILTAPIPSFLDQENPIELFKTLAMKGILQYESCEDLIIDI